MSEKQNVQKRTQGNFDSALDETKKRMKLAIAAIALYFISFMCAYKINETAIWIVVAFWISYLVISIILTYRNTADVRDHLFEALDELDERYEMFEAQNKDLKAQNQELLEKLSRIEAKLGIADEPVSDEPDADVTDADEPEADEPEADEPEADVPEADVPNAENPDA